AAGAARPPTEAKAAKTKAVKTQANKGKRSGGPQTTIDGKPQRATDSAIATFTYRSSAANADFACALDGVDFQACPAEGQTYNDLAPGKHRFEVRAADATGAIDKTPARYGWTIRDAKAKPKSDRGSGHARSDKKGRSAGSRKPANGAPAATDGIGPTVALPFTDDFERDDLSGWSETTGFAIQGQQVAAGAGAARARSSGDPAFATAVFAAPQTDVYARLKYKALSQDAQSVTLLALQKPNGDPLASLSIDRDGRLGLRRAGGKVVRDRAAAAEDAWHEIELHVRTGANGQIEVWQDGAPVDRLKRSISAASAEIGQATIGERAKDRSFDIAFDDVAIATRFIKPDTTAAPGAAAQTKPDEPAGQNRDRGADAPRQDGAPKTKAKGASGRGAALRVTSVEPTNGAKNVAPGAVVSAVFADAIDPATLTDASFTLAP
ncbi:MAG TPA: Ig-like domain-containing protein, partial [Thermomicrobiales bacterium]|nr:Ig-like domain-containing protein [Thermomicrobiales bacterium]